MTIDAIAAIGAATTSATAPAAAPAADGTGFADLLAQGVTKLDTDVQQAESLLQNLAAGRDVPVHDLMIAMEHAKLDLQFAVEVRNRAVEAYQEFMRMQL